VPVLSKDPTGFVVVLVSSYIFETHHVGIANQ